ncbi:MAG TPA: GntR family transcriptional regulator [Acidimicrobiales bacterium]|nr:GntR family transcriptional regulator [Acidimicrobiales bacterium]
MRTAEVVDPLPQNNSAEPTTRQYPKYYVVKGHLAEMLGRLGPGEPLPAERALADTFSTSRTTIRQALQELTIEGKLVRMQGRGTFAALPKMAQPLQLTSYTEDMRRQGLPARSRLLSAGYIKADEELARRLDMRQRARVLRVERLRMAGDEPMAIETTHLEAARFPGLAKRLGDSVSLYALLAEEYGVRLAQAEETIETVPAAPREAEMLDTNIGYPMLLLSRHSRDEQGCPVEFAMSFYRGDRYKFVAQLRPPVLPPRGRA